MPLSKYLMRWRASRKKIRSSLLTLMSYEMKVKISIRRTNDLLSDHVLFMLGGQIEYLNGMIKTINGGKDPLSKKLRKWNIIKENK
jgi:hypothetical protein